MKKLISACMALAAFAAFVLPATASAANDPNLTEGGVAVTAGSTVRGTASNTEFKTTAGGNLVTCSNATMSGPVITNSGGNVTGEITSSAYSGTGSVHSDNGLAECTGTFGNAYITPNLPLCLESTTGMAADEFNVSGGACGGAAGNVKFIIGSTTAGACEYESTNPISGTGTTGGSQATLTVNNTQAGSGSKKIAGGFLCPSSGQLNMTFSLETTNGTALTIS